MHTANPTATRQLRSSLILLLLLLLASKESSVHPLLIFLLISSFNSSSASSLPFSSTQLSVPRTGMTKHPRDGGDAVTLSLSLALGGEAAAERARKQPRRADGEFVCKTCSRAFASFQALGGHRTSHLRGRHGLQLQAAAAPSKAAAANNDNKPAAATTAHECHVCGQGFEMGQALGGHMRRHRDVIAGVAAQAPPVLLQLFV